MNNTDLDMLASANRRARDSLTDEIYQDLWNQVHALTKEYASQAQAWFHDMPDGKWNVADVRTTGIMPHVNYATRELTAQVGALVRQAAIEVRRRCYLRGINSAQVGQGIVGVEPVKPLDAVFPAKRESLRINGKAVSVLPGYAVAGNLTTIDERIQGKDLDRVLAIIDKIPPAIRAIPKRIVLMGLGGVHGEWEDGTIRLNPSVLTSKQKFGTTNKVNQLTHALVHEYMHAWGERAKLDTSTEWLALSGWQYSPDETPEGTERYVEKRKGWPKEKTEWVHATDAWFTRPYGGKAPEEDFADCARDLLLGWDEEFTGGGEAKRDWVRAKLIDVDPGLREAGDWDEEKHPREPSGSDEGGQFASGGGGGSGGGLSISSTKNRVFTGQPRAVKAIIGKQDTGKIGEAVVIAYLRSQGFTDASPMNLDRNNFPIDLVQDHEVIEVKAGLVSNGASAQKWRLTIGEPGKTEKAWLAKASAKAKAKWNAEKQQKIHERKASVLKALSKQLGRQVKPKTMTVILNPDTKSADIYSFEGWHNRIGWNSEMAKNGYVTTVKYR